MVGALTLAASRTKSGRLITPVVAVGPFAPLLAEVEIPVELESQLCARWVSIQCGQSGASEVLVLIYLDVCA